MDMFYELEDLICEKIEEVVKTKDINPTQMECIKNGMKTIYYAEVVDAMRNGDSSYANEEYSGRRSYDNMSNRSYRDNSNSSYRRGYSRHDSKEMMMQKIADLQRQVEQM